MEHPNYGQYPNWVSMKAFMIILFINVRKGCKTRKSIKILTCFLAKTTDKAIKF